ncbi:MAG: rRNA pseudouridine synthase [Leptospira sp.]|nr:rRNA pseudouridine synthase [Leptospira sp.]
MNIKKERLDKALGNLGIGTRKEVKDFIRKQRVKVNGEIVKNPEVKVSYEDIIAFDEEVLDRKEFYFIMINKPTGCVSSTEDPRDKTVMEYLTEREQNRNLFPVGRLDKDSEGLLLITNDGKLAHKLTSPKHNFWKTYYVKTTGVLNQSDVRSFEKGVQIDDGYVCLPAKLEILHSGEEQDYAEAVVKIQEGKFRQIRRMFTALGKEVIYLQRTHMGELKLDENLKLGEYRELTDEEIQLLQNV